MQGANGTRGVEQGYLGLRHGPAGGCVGTCVVCLCVCFSMGGPLRVLGGGGGGERAMAEYTRDRRKRSASYPCFSPPSSLSPFLVPTGCSFHFISLI